MNTKTQTQKDRYWSFSFPKFYKWVFMWGWMSIKVKKLEENSWKTIYDLPQVVFMDTKSSSVCNSENLAAGWGPPSKEKGEYIHVVGSCMSVRRITLYTRINKTSCKRNIKVYSCFVFHFPSYRWDHGTQDPSMVNLVIHHLLHSQSIILIETPASETKS